MKECAGGGCVGGRCEGGGCVGLGWGKGEWEEVCSGGSWSGTVMRLVRDEVMTGMREMLWDEPWWLEGDWWG